MLNLCILHLIAFNVMQHFLLVACSLYLRAGTTSLLCNGTQTITKNTLLSYWIKSGLNFVSTNIMAFRQNKAIQNMLDVLVRKCGASDAYVQADDTETKVAHWMVF